MGTRSLTYFYHDGKPFAAFYRQMDGYPEGHGADLGKILVPITLVNGYQSGQEAGTYANGPGCLAAQVVAKLKDEHGIGGIYLINPNPEENKGGWQEYEYHIHVNTVGKGYDSKFASHIEVTDTVRTIFTGTFAEFFVWAQKPPRNPEGEYLVTTGLKAKATKIRVYRELRDALQHEEVNVTFTKADGSTRDMLCTTDMERIPEDKQPAGTSKVADSRHDPKLYKVYDLEACDWRSFREERIIHWGVAS